MEHRMVDRFCSPVGANLSVLRKEAILNGNMVLTPTKTGCLRNHHIKARLPIVNLQ